MIGFGALVYGDNAFTPKDSKVEKSEVKPLSKNKKKKIIDILSMPVICKPSTSLSENVSQKIKRSNKRRKKK
ncbi:hypothetical protein TRFO_16375 [Tritrichomonas foetus]|uniref:Uncharacterized protein n=1 Tax=Tritrichomonas foetus TaxID=1144522 RepID=A0A1J4KUH5_9EUKA|nr:hypothetical protein TRFO_16375 [Tritrichomonas foetus]|eukprot:OHT13412.1 hypothetical protein TRFO_16375 [Tritrichomonas foetus]